MNNKEFKVVVCGPFGAGRSTFLKKFSDATLKKIPAMKAETYALELHTSAGPCTLTMYDTTLHAKGGLPATDFFRTADAALVLFDLSSSSSMESAEEWFEAFHAPNHRKGQAEPPVLVLGTKLDLARQIAPEKIDWPRKKGLSYQEVSAKANHGIEDALLALVRALLGQATVFTDPPALTAANGKVDEEAAEKAMKAYEAAGSA